jgi:TatD DNase family protein
MLLPLDMHAHIEPGIEPAELDRLGACVVAVTRSLSEYATVGRRADTSVCWGLGCHPGLATAIRSFSQDEFRTGLATAAIVGEVGLDGAAKVPLADQLAVFDEVMSTVTVAPRIVSVHSYKATDAVLDVIDQHRPSGIVLHWWLGDEKATQRAVRLGAHFSVNASQAGKWSALHVVPHERLLTETDHPYGDRRGAKPQRPGNISTVEHRLSDRCWRHRSMHV